MTIPFRSGIDATGKKLINLDTPTSGTDAVNKTYADSLAAQPMIPQVRLFGTSSRSFVDTSSVTSIYLLPFVGPYLSLSDGSNWYTRSVGTGVSLAISSLPNRTVHDVFAYWDSGTSTVKLEFLAWKNSTVTITQASPGVVTWNSHGLAVGDQVNFTSTGALPLGLSDNTGCYVSTVVNANSFQVAYQWGGSSITTIAGGQSGTHTCYSSRARQTAIVETDGVYCKSGDVTRLYVGTFMTNGNPQSYASNTTDTGSFRGIWNMYNRVSRALRITDTTNSWTIAVGSVFRQARADSANVIQVVVGLAEDIIHLHCMGFCTTASTSPRSTTVGIGINVTTTNSADTFGWANDGNSVANNTYTVTHALYYKSPPNIGHTAYLWLEWGDTTGGTVTYYGDNGASWVQSGLMGSFFG